MAQENNTTEKLETEKLRNLSVELNKKVNEVIVDFVAKHSIEQVLFVIEIERAAVLDIVSHFVNKMDAICPIKAMKFHTEVISMIKKTKQEGT